MKQLTLAIATLAILFGAAGAVAATKVNWQSVSVTVPGPGGFYIGPNATLLNANCVTCHTAGFAERQPTLSLATWTAEVTKMKNAYGAPLQDADIPTIAKALVAMQTK